MSKKMEKSITANGPGLIDKGSFGVSALNTSSNVVNPDVTQMLVYHPGQKSGLVLLTNSAASGLLSITSGMPVFEISSFGVGGTNAFDVMLKGAPALVAFIANLPAVEENGVTMPLRGQYPTSVEQTSLRDPSSEEPCNASFPPFQRHQFHSISSPFEPPSHRPKIGPCLLCFVINRV